MTNIQNEAQIKTEDFGTKILGVIGFILVFVIGGLWLFNTELSSAVIVSGKVGVMGEAKLVQHRDGGVVAAIKVAPGQTVEKGDLLVQLDVAEHKIRASANEEKLRYLSARLYRLNAEAAGNELDQVPALKPTKISLASQNPELFRERDLMQMRKINRETSKLRGEIKLEQLENRIHGVDAQLSFKKEEQKLLSDELIAKKTLYDKGYSSLASLRETRKQISILLGSIGKLVAEKAALEQTIEETRVSLKQEEIAFQESVISEIIAIESETRELAKNLLTDKTVISRASIRAPVTGTVHGLDVFTVGGVITPSQELMKIVPRNTEMEIEASIETRFVDDVVPGQSATVRLSGLDARTTPDLTGVVRTVSPDIVVDPKTGAASYSIKVNVPVEEIRKLSLENLVPGMPAEIFINTGERTAFQYLTDPLFEQFRRAFRE